MNAQRQEQTRAILDLLAAHYPRAASRLVYDNPYQLFVATVLSAQTTDDQVNRITAVLFKDVPSFAVLSRLEAGDLEPYLKSCGLYRHKSRFLVEGARVVQERYGGVLPADFNKLLELPGVGRKTASVIISGAFGFPAFAVDTHVFRVSRRLGLAGGKNPAAVEEELKAGIPPAEWVNTHHRLIAHGRALCGARKPQCKSCFLSAWCCFYRERGAAHELASIDKR